MFSVLVVAGTFTTFTSASEDDSTADKDKGTDEVKQMREVMKSMDIKTKVHFIKSMTSFLTSKAPMDAVKMDKMKMCGCADAPVPIKWGNGIGVQCVRLKPEDNPEYDDSCGAVCVDNKGQQLASFCPLGYEPNCEKGCELQESDIKDDNEEPHHLLKNLELIILLLSRNLDAHMIEAFHTPMTERQCGCAEAPKDIDFGSKFGYQCIRHERGHPEAYYEDSCGPVCQDANKSELALFCPPGFTKDCHEGCKWEFGENPGESLNKLVATITGIMTHFKDAFPDPSVQTVLDCGCKEKPSSLGTGLGKTCVRNQVTFDDTKCLGVRCAPESIDYVIFCPIGFAGNCKDGCSLEIGHDEL
jgi:hypothetical protein